MKDILTWPVLVIVQDYFKISKLFYLTSTVCERKHLYIVIFRCDADPSALANYVVALVKKDKPEKELKALCADQLDVFLQKGISST